MPKNDGSYKDTAIVIGEVTASEDEYDPEKFDVSVLVEDSDMEVEIPGLSWPCSSSAIYQFSLFKQSTLFHTQPVGLRILPCSPRFVSYC